MLLSGVLRKRKKVLHILGYCDIMWLDFSKLNFGGNILEILLLLGIIVGGSLQSVVKKPYTQKLEGKGMYFFCLVSCVSAMLFFIATSSGFTWDSGIFLYSFWFAIGYAAAAVGMLAAISCGPLSLSSLFLSFSSLIPTVYGLIFLHDPISKGFIPGIALLIISLILINKKGEDSAVSFKWVICIVITFVGNGMCSVVQKMQQMAFGGNGKNEFMIMALCMVTVLLLVLTIRQERTELKQYAKVGGIFALASGVTNGITNLLSLMLLSSQMPVSLIYPLTSSGGIVLTYLISVFFYKERLTKMQNIGFIIGTASVVFLSI